MLTVADAGEHVLIERIRARAHRVTEGVRLGIGDDAALITPERGRDQVLTTDTLVEDVHFKLGWSTAESVGRKAILVNLSDLAAMGAKPQALLLSLCLPPAFPLSAFDNLIDGIAAEADAARAVLAGGNITRSPGPLVISVTATGSVHPRRVLRRDGGRPGDELYLTGPIGAAAAGLEVLSSGPDLASLDTGLAACVGRYEAPPRRVTCGRAVAGHRAASACIDLSDGLADAVRQIARASGTGAQIRGDAVPIDDEARNWWTSGGGDALLSAIQGGEDYELLFAVPPKRRRAFLAAMTKSGIPTPARVGQLTSGRDCVLSRGESTELLPAGFEHFGRK